MRTKKVIATDYNDKVEMVGALSKLLGKLLDNTNHKSTRNWTVDSWLPKLPTVLLSPRQGQEVITIVVTISHFFFLSITVTLSYTPIPILLRRGVRSDAQLSCTETQFQKCC